MHSIPTNIQDGAKKLAIIQILLNHKRYSNIINHLIKSMFPLLHAFPRRTFPPRRQLQTPKTISTEVAPKWLTSSQVQTKNSRKPRASKIPSIIKLHLPFLAHLWQYFGGNSKSPKKGNCHKWRGWFRNPKKLTPTRSSGFPLGKASVFCGNVFEWSTWAFGAQHITCFVGDTLGVFPFLVIITTRISTCFSRGCL